MLQTRLCALDGDRLKTLIFLWKDRSYTRKIGMGSNNANRTFPLIASWTLIRWKRSSSTQGRSCDWPAIVEVLRKVNLPMSKQIDLQTDLLH